MEIPYAQLSEEVLEAVIEEFITREGTDYSEVELSLANKVDQVREQLRRGEVFLSFDPLTESCQLQPKEQRIDFDTLVDERVESA